jgi:glycine betaine/proline transport system ATP-binding protein
VSAVRVEGLTKVFARRPEQVVHRLRSGATAAELRAEGATAAVIDATFAIEPGEIFVVMGLSGSGKSTLLRMLNGLLPPTEGRVLIGDADLTALSGSALRRLRQERISMVFQHFALLPHRNVAENAAYGLEVRGVDRRTRLACAREALAMVGLEGWADARPGELSGGMQQRVGLARALAAETDVLLMDEAFSALDPLIRREMQDQLLDLHSRLGRTIVFITHDLNEAMRLGDRVAVMRDGRIVQLDTPEAILTAPADEYVAQFLADVDRSRVLTAADVMVRPRTVLAGGPAPRPVGPVREPQAALVVDSQGRLTGVMAETALRGGAQSLQDAVRPPAACVPPTTPVADLLAPAAASAQPVVVVDDDGRPLGVVPRSALLAALDGAPPADAPAAAPGLVRAAS